MTNYYKKDGIILEQCGWSGRVRETYKDNNGFKDNIILTNKEHENIMNNYDECWEDS